MTRRHILIALLTILMLLPVHASGQRVGSTKITPGSPEDVFLKAIQTLKKDRVEDFARAIDPEDLKRFQKLLLTLVELAEKKGEEQQLLRIFSGVKSVNEVKALAPVPFFVSFFKGVEANRPEMREIMAGSKETMIGRVDAGKNATYLVYRSLASLEDQKIDETKVVALTRVNGRWSMRLDGDLERMVLILKRQLEGKKPESPRMEKLTVQTFGRINDQEGTALIPCKVTVPIGDLSFTKLVVYSIKKTDRGYNMVRDGKSPELTAAIRDNLRRQMASLESEKETSGRASGEDQSPVNYASGSPEDVFQKSRAALKQRKFQDYAQLIVPDDLRRFQKNLMSLVEVAKKRGEDREALRLFDGVKSIDDLNSLSPASFFAAFSNGLRGSSPELRESLGNGKIKLVGRVDERPDTTYLIYRVSPPEQVKAPDAVRVIALHRDNNQWKISLDGELERTLLVLKSQLEGASSDPQQLGDIRVETVGRLDGEDGTVYIPYRVKLPAGSSEVTRFGVYPVKKTESVYNSLGDGKTPEIRATIRDMLKRNFAAKEAADRKNIKP